VVAVSFLVKALRGDLKKTGDFTLRQQIQALGLTLSEINDWVRERFPAILTPPIHLINQGVLFG
jgi:hypothetical protein